MRQIRIYRPKNNGIWAIQLTSILMGYLIFKLSFMSPRWAVSGLGAILVILSGLLVKDARRFFLALFTLSLPIAAFNYVGQLDDYHYGGASGLFHTLFDCFLAILYALWFPQILLLGEPKIKLTKLDVFFTLILLTAVLSMYNATFIMFSLYDLFRLVIMYLVFLYLANNLTSERDFKIFIGALFIGLFFECFLGVSQYMFGEILGLGLLGEKSQMMEFHTLSRVGGTLGHPNSFARYLGFLIPLTISLQFSNIKGIYKIFCGILFVLATGNLIMTFSRASWVGFILSITGVFFISLFGRMISLRKAFWVIVLGLLFLTGLFFIYQDAIFTRLFMDDFGSVASRIPQMEIAFNIIEAHPLIGIGLNNYSEVMHLFDNTPERITNYFLNTVHNVYLLIASEIGIPGLIFFLCFTAVVFMKGLDVIHQGHPFYGPLVTGILAGIISFLIQILVMPPTLTSTSFVFFWVLSAVVAAASHAVYREREAA